MFESQESQSRRREIQMKHTDRPWKVRSRFDIVQDRGNQGGDFVGTVRGNSPYLPASVKEQDEANAEFIVRAVNAHDELLSALNGLLCAHDSGTIRMMPEHTAVIAARSAIAKAEGTIDIV